MNKVITSVSFYVAAVCSMLLMINETSNVYTLVGFLIIVALASIAKVAGTKYMLDVLGITWLQKKFENNPVIMDMTNE